MRRGDEIGLFWNDPPKRKADFSARPLPPIPDTGWELPEGPELFPNLEGRGPIAIDCETFDPDLKAKGPGAMRDGRIVGVAIGAQDFRQYYPIDHQIGPNLPKEVVFGWLKEQLSRPGQPKVGARLLYDLEYLAVAGVPVAGPFWDVQVAEPLLDETRLTYSLESIAQHHFGQGKVESTMRAWLEAAYGNKEDNIKTNIWRAPSAVIGPYAEGDVDLPLRIFAEQRKALKEQGLWTLFEMESALIPMLLAMRLRGVRVNLDHTEQLSQLMKDRKAEALAEIKRQSGKDADIWAADSIAAIFNSLSISYPRTEKTNAPSFRKEWLTQHQHPVARLIVKARGLDKLDGTFLQGYILNGHVNGRIHTEFHQLRSDEGGTVSGRFSSSHPNLQNIPIRDKEYGKAIRNAFVPDEGCDWWKFDWSQIEYRLIVHYAYTRKLRGADQVVRRYSEDPSTDYHQIIAEMTGLPRSDAKNLNFGLAYGQGVDLLCHNLGVEREEGERIINEYHTKAPFIRPLADSATKAANRYGVIPTLLRRLRRFNTWEVNGQFFNAEPENKHARRAFTHKALNALIQGSAADIMKKAMVQIWNDGCCDILGAPHLTVHDELDGSLEPTPAAREALAHVKHVMETCVELAVPLRADGGTGPSWGAIA